MSAIIEELRKIGFKPVRIMLGSPGHYSEIEINKENEVFLDFLVRTVVLAKYSDSKPELGIEIEKGVVLFFDKYDRINKKPSEGAVYLSRIEIDGKPIDLEKFYMTLIKRV